MKHAINRILARDFVEDVHKCFIDQGVVKKKLICIGREQQGGGTKLWEKLRLGLYTVFGI